jgi:DNA-binding transcriptional MerR regulator
MAIEAGRPYMSIGEVLNVLKDEFSDVTVSKIRFLESENLIHPERTPSGYRKFSATDIERLRFILRLQRDHFLPLKVIRERLAEWETGGGQATLGLGEPEPEQAPVLSAVEQPDDLTVIETGLSLSAGELASASGLSERDLEELRGFGLVEPKDLGDGGSRYNEVDLQVAKLCRELMKLGLEPRHMRLFKSSVDRLAALAEQMVMPLVKQRNPEARRLASETIRELVRIGNRLNDTLLREALSSYA